MGKLKPCPFCGNKTPVYWCYPKDETLFTDRWAVLCYYPDGGCGAEGSHQKSKEEAAAAWNEREGVKMIEIKEKEVMMPVTVLSKACKDCERLDITIHNTKQYSGPDVVVKENTLRCTYLNECKMYAKLVDMIITKDEEE